MVRALLALAFALAVAAPAAADWVRLETPHFIFFGEVGERRTRDDAKPFERFREALAGAVPVAKTRASTPTLVFLFEHQRSMSSIDRVGFITDTSRQGGIGCGPRPADDRVYVSYLPTTTAPQLDGIVVAVEFLPQTVR